MTTAEDAALEALKAQSFFTQCPEAVGIISNEGILRASNARFERTVGPAKTLVGTDFVVNCIAKEDHPRFKIAMTRAREARDAPPSQTDASDLVEWALTPTVRSVSSICMGNSGDFPIWRKMDWTLTIFDDTRSCDAPLLRELSLRNKSVFSSAPCAPPLCRESTAQSSVEP